MRDDDDVSRFKQRELVRVYDSSIRPWWTVILSKRRDCSGRWLYRVRIYGTELHVYGQQLRRKKARTR